MNAKLCRRRGYFSGVLLCLWALLTLFGDVSPANAQPFTDIGNPFSPLLWLPSFRGEARLTLIWMYPISGKQRIPDFGVEWNLKDQLGMGGNKDYMFLDAMLRLQLDRFSVRFHYEMRDFVGMKSVTNQLGQPWATSRLSFSGFRLGGDVDIFPGGWSRVGFNLDYDFYNPIFTEGIQTPGGKELEGEAPVTWGVHAMFNPVVTWYGISPLFEVRARWPLYGTKVTDFEICAGLKSPETVLGSVGFRGGYRRTSLEFSDSQIYNNVPVSTDFNALMQGWFVDVVYYY